MVVVAIRGRGRRRTRRTGIRRQQALVGGLRQRRCGGVLGSEDRLDPARHRQADLGVERVDAVLACGLYAAEHRYIAVVSSSSATKAWPRPSAK